MLTELWERIRGYDKWPQTEATIRTSTLAEVEVGHTRGGEPVKAWQNSCVLVWRDANGEEELDDFSVFGDSPLFELYEGQKVTIHCDPAGQSKYFFPELFRSRTIREMRIALVILIVAGLFIAEGWALISGRIGGK